MTYDHNGTAYFVCPTTLAIVLPVANSLALRNHWNAPAQLKAKQQHTVEDVLRYWPIGTHGWADVPQDIRASIDADGHDEYSFSWFPGADNITHKNNGNGPPICQRCGQALVWVRGDNPF